MKHQFEQYQQNNSVAMKTELYVAVCSAKTCNVQLRKLMEPSIEDVSKLGRVVSYDADKCRQGEGVVSHKRTFVTEKLFCCTSCS